MTHLTMIEVKLPRVKISGLFLFLIILKSNDNILNKRKITMGICMNVLVLTRVLLYLLCLKCKN